MVPLVAASLISGGTAAGQGILGMMQNKKNREFAEQQTLQARQWALQDWQSQNEYNSPRAQMQRLQEAGLNPNLVYGTGAATQQVQPIKPTEQKSWQGQTPDFSGLQNTLFTHVDLQAKKAQVDLLEVQKTVQLNNALLTAAKTAESQIKQAKDSFTLSQAKALSTGVLEAQKLNLQKLTQDIDLDQKRFGLSLQANERADMLASNSIQEAVQKIAESKSRVWLNQFEGQKKEAETQKIKKTISLMNQDTETRELNLKLQREGLQPTDPTWQRVMLQQVKKWFPDLF